MLIYKGGQNMLSLYVENDYFNKELYKLKKKVYIYTSEYTT